MKPEQISEALGHLLETMIQETLATRQKRKRKTWVRWVAAAACFALVLGLVRYLWFGKENPGFAELEANQTEWIPVGTQPKPVLMAPDTYLIVGPQYPAMPQFPQVAKEDPTAWNEVQRWREEKERFYSFTEGFSMPKGFLEFYRKTASVFLQKENGGNAAYSPLNVYMALAILAELTDGRSRDQILTLLELENMEQLRLNATALWLSNYCDDGTLTTILGNSLWLREETSYREDTLKSLAEIYYASSYRGTMGSEEYNQALRSWVNEHTAGLLGEETQSLSLDADTVLALVSTLYFKGGWAHTFREEENTLREFHGTDESETVEFLHSSGEDYIFSDPDFTACALQIEDEALMWLILPEEGIRPEELLQGEGVYALTSARGAWEDMRKVELSLYVPKFDITATTDLCSGLKSLGVADVMDPTQADFSPLTSEEDGIFVSRMEHTARVRVDEEGCEATAYTMILLPATGRSETLREVELVFDRPFIFVITGRTGQPLFTGIVSAP